MIHKRRFRNKKYNPDKLRLSRLIGLIVSWEDKTPLVESWDREDLGVSSITHTNPNLAKKANAIFCQAGSRLLNKDVFTWRVTITACFYYPDIDTDAEEIRILTARCPFIELDEHGIDAIEDAMRHGKAENYQTTKFTAEIIR